MVVEIMAGIFVGFMVVGIILWWTAKRVASFEMLRGDHGFEASTKKARQRFPFWFTNTLQAAGKAKGRPELSVLWARLALIASGGIVAFSVMLRQPLILCGIPAIFVATWIYAKEILRTTEVRIRGETRMVQVLVAFLLRAGANLSETMELVEQHIEEPLRSKIHRVNITKRYTTLQGALYALSDEANSRQLSEFASIIGESQAYGTPVADAVMRGLRLDGRLRDADAHRRYGEVQLELTLIAMLLIAFPGFGFVLFALLSYVLHIFSGAMLA